MMKQPMIIGVLGLTLTMSVTFPSGSSSETVERRIGVAAFSDWHADDPGVWRKIAPDDLPRPLASEPKASRSEVVARPEGATPKTLEGFSVEAFATGLTGPRVIRVAPNGDILVAESSAGRVRVFRLADGAIKPEKSEIFASDLERPYGVAFYPPGPDPKFVYVGTVSKIVRFPYRKGDLKASGPAEVVASLPASETGHWSRDIAFSADGKTLFVAVGSKSNVADGHVRPSPTEVAELEARNGVGASSGPEQDRANILAFNPNGGDKRVFARGIRNCSGLQVRPNTDDLWCVVNERDMLGDDLPPDYATRVEPGAFYGWPWYYIGANPDPRHAGAHPLRHHDDASAVVIGDVPGAARVQRIPRMRVHRGTVGDTYQVRSERTRLLLNAIGRDRCLECRNHAPSSPPAFRSPSPRGRAALP